MGWRSGQDLRRIFLLSLISGWSKSGANGSDRTILAWNGPWGKRNSREFRARKCAFSCQFSARKIVSHNSRRSAPCQKPTLRFHERLTLSKRPNQKNFGSFWFERPQRNPKSSGKPGAPPDTQHHAARMLPRPDLPHGRAFLQRPKRLVSLAFYRATAPSSLSALPRSGLTHARLQDRCIVFGSEFR